jgi:hypothetical protein
MTTSPISTSNSFAQLTRLLEALARDWPTFADNLARLGDTISDCLKDQGNTQHMREMQAFDTLGQLAQAHGAVLANIAKAMSGAGTPDDIKAAIARIPFRDMRRHLQAAFHGAQNAAKGHCDACEYTSEEGAIFWL